MYQALRCAAQHHGAVLAVEIEQRASRSGLDESAVVQGADPLLRQALAPWDNVEACSFDGLLVDYARQLGATAILRGIRAMTDLEYEMQMAMMNRTLEPGLETVFLIPSETYSYVSSRLVREVARLGGSVGHLVPARVERALARRFGRD